MQIRVQDDKVIIDGYVNAIERKSRPLSSRIGKFRERICKGAFKKAIERNANIRILENHDWNRDLGGTGDGNLELREDNIGLHAHAEITDPVAVKKARNGDYGGWSFGFQDRDVDTHNGDDGLVTRDVKDLDLFEVSLLDRTKTPAYDGTLVSVRSEENIQYRSEPFITDVEVRDETQPKQQTVVKDKDIDYSKYEKLIQDMKGDN